MATKSKITKKYKGLSILFSLLSFIVMFAPLAYYFIVAAINAEMVQKVTLGLMFSAAAVITAINVAFKAHYRSAIWITLLGIYFCIKEIMPLLIAVAVGTILDEFLFTPLHKHYKQLGTINYEIDKRI